MFFLLVLHPAHRVHFWDSNGSQNKQRLLHYTALTDRFFIREKVCLLRGTDWVFKYNSGYLQSLNGY